MVGTLLYNEVIILCKDKNRLSDDQIKNNDISLMNEKLEDE